MSAESSESSSAPSSDSTPARKRSWLRPLLLIFGPLVVVIIGGYMYLTSGRYVTTENAYVKADKIAISADVSGRVVAVNVRENDLVADGQALFQIDKRLFEITLDRAAAEVGMVAHEIGSYRAAYNQELEELKIARDDLDFAEKEFNRQQRLLDRGIVSEVQYDEARHSLEIARKKVTATEAAIVHALANLGGDENLSTEQHPRYRRAVANRDQALLDLLRTTVRAPAGGVVGNIVLQVGEYVEAGKPVFSLVSNEELWISVNLKETDLTHVEVGQEVIVQADTYPDHHWRALVDSISPATGAEFALLPPQNASGNWVKVVQRIPVRVVLQDPFEDGPSLRAGMSVEVTIDTQFERPLPPLVRSALTWIQQATTYTYGSDNLSTISAYQ